MNNVRNSARVVFGCGLVLSLAFPPTGALAQEQTLYSFSGSDGGNPPCGLISGGRGVPAAKSSLYGVTEEGGADGYGAVFKLGKTGSESVIYSFTGGSDGAQPEAALLTDGIGDFYGTTEAGGANGLGVVFKVTTAGSESTLHSFAGGSDGANPVASLIMDKSGNLYGTTEYGGTNGLGTVFKVTPGGSESVLYSFGGSDGSYPLANLVMDTAGNLYGTTSEGGGSKTCSGGCGTIFMLAANGTESVLHSFAGGSDGANPYAGLLLTKSGIMFGTTRNGGTANAGTVFELAHKGQDKVLHSFAGGTDGAYPVSAVTAKTGYLYGTTLEGGASGYGTVYKTSAKVGGGSVLYSFTGGSDGGFPKGGLLDQAGNLFGTAYAGGNAGCNADQGCGVVFELTP